MKKPMPTLIAAVSCALLAIAVFAPALSYNFVNWDDNRYVYANNDLINLHGLDYLRWAFTTNRGGHWAPMMWLSYGLDHRVWGLNPLGYHLTNILLHALCTLTASLLAAMILSRVADNEGIDMPVWVGALVTGLLFGLHPTRVQSVAWVAERKDVLFAVWFLLSAALYFHAKSGKPRPAVYWVSVFCFMLALMSKAMAITLPAVLVLLDLYPLRRVRDGLRPMLTDKLPYMAAGLVYAYLEFNAAVTAGLLKGRYGIAERVWLSVESIGFYIAKVFLPAGMSPFYPLPEKVSALSMPVMGSLVLVALAAAAAIYCLRRGLWPAVAAMAFSAITLSPVIGILQHGAYTKAVHYLYIPALGPFVLAGWIAASLWARSRAAGRAALASVVAITAVAMVLGSLSNMPTWREKETLWLSVERHFPYDQTVLSNLAESYFERGAMKEGLAALDRAIEHNPSAAWLYNKRGRILMDIKQPLRAIDDFAMAARLEQGDRRLAAEYYTNLGAAYGGTGMFRESVEASSKAIAISPDLPAAYVNRARCYTALGESDNARADLMRAASLGDAYAIKALGAR